MSCEKLELPSRRKHSNTGYELRKPCQAAWSTRWCVLDAPTLVSPIRSGGALMIEMIFRKRFGEPQLGVGKNFRRSSTVLALAHLK